MMEAVVLIGILGILFGVGLAYASRKFEVHVDARVKEISELLPGANCGGCGFPGCATFASALVGDPSLINECKVCDEKSWVKICNILGIELGKQKVALVACSYGSGDKFEYQGIRSCAAAARIMGGFTICKYACLGFGDCVNACSFDAIEMRDHNFFVDLQKCIGCGACVDACPRGVIKHIDKDATVFIRCNSRDKGKIVAKICETGCVGGKLCTKACELGAIKVENNLAIIDYNLCNGCGNCLEACEYGTIVPIID